MTAKLPASTVDNLIQLYRSGMSVKQIQRELDIGEGTIYHYLRERGVARNGRERVDRSSDANPRFNASLPVEEIVTRYLAGESVNALAKTYGVSRNVIGHRLDMAGVRRRGVAEVNQQMMADRSPDEHRRNTSAAHEASRGRQATLEERCRTAATRERKQLGVSPAELLLARWLTDRGLDPIPQKAIGPYNCDLAVNPVAVEIFGGGWHGHGRHRKRAAERTRYLLDQRWLLVMIWVDQRRHPLTEGAADYVAATVQEVRRDPSLRGEYRVIWGGGEFYTRGRDELDQLTLKPSFTGRRRNWT